MSRDLLVRPVRDEERSPVLAVIRAAYSEFEPALTPPEWMRMSANLAGIVAAGAPGVLSAAFDAEAGAVGTVTYLPPGPREYARVPTDWAVVRAMAVRPECRGHGVGRALLADCLDRARADGAPWVGLHTAEIFHAARGMYERAGLRRLSEFEHLGARFFVYGLDLRAAG